MVNFDLEDGNLGLKPFQLMILRFRQAKIVILTIIDDILLIFQTLQL